MVKNVLICICPCVCWCVCWFRLNLSPFQSSFSKYPNIKTFYGARRIMICAWLPVCHVCLLGAHWCEKLGLLSWYFYPNRQVISGWISHLREFFIFDFYPFQYVCLKWSFASWKSKARLLRTSTSSPSLIFKALFPVPKVVIGVIFSSTVLVVGDQTFGKQSRSPRTETRNLEIQGGEDVDVLRRPDRKYRKWEKLYIQPSHNLPGSGFLKAELGLGSFWPILSLIWNS